MPPWLQAVRVFGVAVVFYAAWYHVPAGVISGLALIAVCWANGLFRHGAAPRAYRATKEAAKYGERGAHPFPHRQGRTRNR